MPPDTRVRPRTVVTLLLAVLVTAGLLALGTWQVKRLFWKLDLIARVEARVQAPPGAIPAPDEWSDFDPATQEYRHIRLSGTFLHDKEVLAQANTILGPGFWVLTPLIQADGSVILINRGFVPPDRRDPATRTDGNPSGTVDVVGLLRLSEPKGAFLRSNDAATGRWYSRDVQAIAEAKGLPADKVAPFFIDADKTPNPGGYPVGGLTQVVFPNNHLVYAITWYSLAGMLMAVIIVLYRRRQI
ncbi:Surfeit locus 1 family protein [Xaviernesmea oryzae]|uniref:SURF1-like protein n=1 Tax=Xaviernesmea oryzae TaxID=464029 RepID=A0A1Q9B271_9HYPH|nr:SURF1 family protein [Xaviernesmea oryzae]OLP62094.1 Surfeit locus 1 family protein [Xaviernesmea oryzae]SEL87163.1 surfeit locus 1 family protein [Xaviernesmea oryzae]